MITDNQGESATNPINPSITETTFTIPDGADRAEFTVIMAAGAGVDPCWMMSQFLYNLSREFLMMSEMMTPSQ